MAKNVIEGMVDGTSISKSAMARMLEASSKAVGEGVAGTSPTPGQDQNLGFIPPTTSGVTNPGELGGEDPENQNVGDPDTLPKQTSEQRASEEFQRSLDTLFAEKKNDDDDDDNGDNGNDDDDKKKDKKKDGDEDDGDKVYSKKDKDDEKAECMEVHCKECGYEESYDLSEQAVALNPPPMTESGEIDTKCPMCGADMDFSLIGATDQGKIQDPNPIAGPRGEGGTEVPQEALAYARTLMRRVAEGSKVEELSQEVLESDFLVRA
jgi:hypothetical protein